MQHNYSISAPSAVTEPAAVGSPPSVLVIAGLDPGGGAGLSADIATLQALGCHAAPIASCLTVQDSVDAWRIEPVDPLLALEQVDAVLADQPVAAIKLGLLADARLADALRERFTGLNLPIVIDPVLRSGAGSDLSADTEALTSALTRLLKIASVATPNRDEYARLGQPNDCPLLITGGDSLTDHQVINRLQLAGQPDLLWHWPRLAGSYHGSGCTLASALAASLAHGYQLPAACLRAQQQVAASLQYAYRAGRGQLIPQRNALTRRPALQGLYAIADTGYLADAQLLPAAAAALAGGARLLQYRDKSAHRELRLQQAGALAQLCRQHGALFLINDDIELAQQIGADGVHLGRDDGALHAARARLGPNAIIGASCYNDLSRARRLQVQADYLAFGACYPSSTKPDAAQASKELLAQACRELARPVVAIGGITPENGAPLLAAGVSALAVIGSLFADPEPAAVHASAQAFQTLFD